MNDVFDTEAGTWRRPPELWSESGSSWNEDTRVYTLLYSLLGNNVNITSIHINELFTYHCTAVYIHDSMNITHVHIHGEPHVQCTMV